MILNGKINVATSQTVRSHGGTMTAKNSMLSTAQKRQLDLYRKDSLFKVTATASPARADPKYKLAKKGQSEGGGREDNAAATTISAD